MSTALNLTRDRTMTVNPFTDNHWRDELKAYGLKNGIYRVDNVHIRWTYIYGRCDDYLNVNMRFDKATKFPQLIINDQLWMSLSPMEIQSTALAIHRATGHVLCVGLGLGYFALRAAAKPDVTKITVFEQEPEVIAWFKRAFKKRPELEKMEFVEGDARITMKGYTADMAYVDIYRTQEPAIFADEKLFRRRNKITRYMFWGYERFVLGLICNKMLEHPALFLGNDLRSYFTHWKTTPCDQENDDGSTLSNLCRAQDMPDMAELCRAKIAVTRDYPI